MTFFNILLSEYFPSIQSKKGSNAQSVYPVRLLLTFTDCAAERDNLCQNGAVVTGDCKCQCGMGWMGDKCSGM